jgi:leucyl/phenylalanyl-tRNA--protein transferase
VERFGAWGFHFVDCQVETEHLARFGAVPWPRRRFLTALKRALQEPTRRGPWPAPETTGA